MKVIILAAGMGTRLGNLIPKPLTALKNEKTILDYQISNITKFFDLHDILIVVGYKHHLIMEKFPQLIYIYNHEYAQTNTAKSLLYALNKIKDEDILWLNGDVVFDGELIKLLLECKDSCCLVDNKKCSKEEIKYTQYENGYIKKLSKEVNFAMGEALGINLIKKDDLEPFKKELGKVNKNDYFEKALENLTLKNKINLKPLNSRGLFCHEIDFPEDLEIAKKHINPKY